MFLFLYATTLDQMIGAKLIFGFEGQYIEEPSTQKALSYAKQKKIGGIILFAHNINSPHQLKKLICAFKKVNPGLLIGVDQEGGKVARLKPPFIKCKNLSAKEVSQKFTPYQAEAYYNNTARQVAQYGFNLNFGPVVDIDPESYQCPVIGGINRSFGKHPKEIIAYAKSFIKAYHGNGIITVIKHYPGHGYAKKDTHRDLTDITNTHSKCEELPYKELSSLAPVVMMAHLIDLNVDKKFPASLSAKHVKKLKTYYKGVLISDDYMMGAILKHYEGLDALTLAVKAGIDLIIYSGNPKAAPTVDRKNLEDLPDRFIERVKDGITKGEISKESIEESYKKVSELKKHFGIFG